MTDKAFPRPVFDRGVEFVVQRAMLLSGKTITPGTLFDKALVNPRKLRQLYDQRYLRFAEASDLPPPRSRLSRIRSTGGSRGTRESKSA